VLSDKRRVSRDVPFSMREFREISVLRCLSGLLLVSLAFGCQQSSDERAIAEVIRMGGEVKKDGTQPGLPVTEVKLYKSKVTDGELKVVKSFPHLRTLDLRHTMISDRGLTNLTGLNELENLLMDSTNVTDDGLIQLKGMKTLKKVTLDDTDVSDRGLVSLEDLPNLSDLSLRETQVTRDAVRRFKEAHGKVWINHGMSGTKGRELQFSKKKKQIP
jgi:hypothetical protein